jgi:hypothetical protein
MYKDSIFRHNTQAQKNVLKQSPSNNYLLDHQKLSSLSKTYDSIHSLPILFKEKTSFAQFIADEKYNLQFFHSFKETGKIINKQKEKKKLIRNFHLLSVDMPKKCYSPLNDWIIFDDKKTSSCVTHSSNFARRVRLNTASATKTKPINDTLSHKWIDIADINRKRRMRCIERHISYMNNEQTKAAICFILQLNTYFNQKPLSLQKESNKINKDYVESKKVY